MDKERLIQDLLDQVGDPATLAKEMATFETSIKEWFANFDRYRREYLGKWVALYEGRVCGSAETLEALLRQIDEMGIPRGSTFIQHPVENEPILLL